MQAPARRLGRRAGRPLALRRRTGGRPVPRHRAERRRRGGGPAGVRHDGRRGRPVRGGPGLRRGPRAWTRVEQRARLSWASGHSPAAASSVTRTAASRSPASASESRCVRPCGVAHQATLHSPESSNWQGWGLWLAEQRAQIPDAIDERPSRRREHGAVPALGVAHKLSPAGSASGRTSTSGWRREPVWAHAGGRQAQGPRGQPASGEAGRTSLTASSNHGGEATSSAASSSRLPPRASRVRALGRAQAGIESRSVQRASGPRASRAL